MYNSANLIRLFKPLTHERRRGYQEPPNDKLPRRLEGFCQTFQRDCRGTLEEVWRTTLVYGRPPNIPLPARGASREDRQDSAWDQTTVLGWSDPESSVVATICNNECTTQDQSGDLDWHNKRHR